MSDSYRYAVGDIHGCINTFRNMVEEKLKLRKEDKLFLLGDYVDRGPDCKAVLDYIIELVEKGFSVFPLLGNHEDMMLKASKADKFFMNWMMNGAASTLSSFDLYPEIDSLQKIPPKYMQFIENLTHYKSLNDFVLVHAGINFMANDPFRDKEAMLWSRDFQYDGEMLENRKIIHGHTPTSLEEILKKIHDKDSNLINLDGGCVYKGNPVYGNLVALNIDTWEPFHVSNMD